MKMSVELILKLLFFSFLTKLFRYGTIKNTICGCGGMADALDLGSSGATREGSSPFIRTTVCLKTNVFRQIFCYRDKKSQFAALFLENKRVKAPKSIHTQATRFGQ